MKEVENIRMRFERGYTITLYGNREKINEQINLDIEYLLRFINLKDQ